MSTNQSLPPPQERQQDQLSAQAQYAPPPPPSQAGFSLQDLFARWQAVLLEPSLAKLDAQRREANWQTIWFSLLGLAIVQAAVAVFQQAEALTILGPESPTFRQGVNGPGLALLEHPC